MRVRQEDQVDQDLLEMLVHEDLQESLDQQGQQNGVNKVKLGPQAL